MAQPHIQHSFHSGEWAPALNARVDMAKYHAAAALMRNFFVDYRGGASSCPGTKYILQAKAPGAWLIPFQASSTVGYILEFGQNYIRFFFQGGAVLEASVTVTSVAGNVVTAAGHGYAVGDWVFYGNKYYIITAITTNTFTVTDLRGNVPSLRTAAAVQRVYTIPSPYNTVDLPMLKFAQNVQQMILTHKNYSPYVLTLVSATNWTLNPIVFGATVHPPTGVAASTTLAAGTWNYSYVVTAVDNNGQESGASTPATLASKGDIRVTPSGTTQITWSASPGANFYNVYEAELSSTNPVPGGAAYGFIGFTTGTSFSDSNIPPDFQTTPPIPQNPFVGSGVTSVSVGSTTVFTTVPLVTFSAPPIGGTATGTAVLQLGAFGLLAGGFGYVVGQAVNFGFGVVLIVASIGGGGAITAFQPLTYSGTSRGYITTGTPPVHMTAVGSVDTSSGGAQIDVTNCWGVGQVQIIQQGSGYLTPPTVTFSSGTVTATAVLGSPSSGNPSVCVFFDQRLGLMGPPGAPNQMNFSIPGTYFNFNVSNPVQADDAITANLVSKQLQDINNAIAMASGCLVTTSTTLWQINGGAKDTGITPIDITANPQSYVGSAGLPPIISNYDMLYVQAKGSIVRDTTYNFYANVWTGTDISVLSSHLFYGFSLVQWAWAEEPYKVVWAVRDDGELLSLTFVKEQEIVGWAHRDTQGSFLSVATVVEPTDTAGNVDAVYLVVQRTVQGHTLQYIERMAERSFPNGKVDAWCVDSGLQSTSGPFTTFSGLEHLEGLQVVGLADGLPVGPLTVVGGSVTLPAPATKVTLGLKFLPQLQTLQLDLGEPTAQGKRKKIPAVTARVKDSLGLKIGSSFDTLVPMKDLVLGNVGSATDVIVTDLVTADARTLLDPLYQVPGQYCFQQDLPYPVSILGVIPEVTVGDTGNAR
jgi:hypothetical protein